MNKLEVPKTAFKPLKKPNKLLILSLITAITANIINILGLNYLDLKIRIIISLSIISFILLVDVIVLYTQYYMFYYQSEYLNKVYDLIDINVKNLGKTIDKLQSESSEIKLSVEKNNDEIKSLKSDIT